MTTVKLDSAIVNGSVKFSGSQTKTIPVTYFSQPEVKGQIKDLYKKMYQLNSWRTFDKKDIMGVVFGR